MTPRFAKSTYLLLFILTISGFTHIWNATAFPDIFFDEGVYMRRAMHVLSGLGPQESFFHDHPYFGQIFLASIFGITGFPNSLHTSPTPDSISMLYFEPRIIMGLLAVVDTFLVYKIAENRYDSRVALISSILFAVMPITWLLRRILLDSILLPFLLLSILLALNSKNSRHPYLMIVFSGVCLGLAIFTKVSVFTMIPLIAGLVYFYNNRNSRFVILWLIPVLLIPLLWPIQSIESGQFNLWIKDVVSQTQRVSWGLPYISYSFLLMDPVLFILGISGVVFCVIRKDYFILMWFVPFIIFLFAIGYNQYFYWIPVLPVFCISASILITKTLEKTKKENLKNLSVVVLCITVFGFVSTFLIIQTNMTSAEYEAISYVLQNVKDNDKETTILSSPADSWIFNYVFHKENVFPDYTQILWQPVNTTKIMLVVDEHYFIDMPRGKQFQQLYNESSIVTSFNIHNPHDVRFYPYTNLRADWGGEGGHIEIREK